MSVIKVTLPLGEIPAEGKQVSFKAPCPCDVTEAIQIEGVNYTVCDALGKCVTGVGGMWDVGSIVTVILSVEQKKAYIQNNAAYSPVNKPSLAELGAAPAGFGLGVFDESNPITKEELNTPRGNGWRYISAPSSEWSDVFPGLGTIWGVVRIDGLNDAYCRETIYDWYYGNNVTRVKYGSSGWQPWEWTIPPMQLGVEHRTTERIAGKAVYKKNVDGIVYYRLGGETEWKPYVEAGGGSRIVLGSYVGTGQCGASYPTSLTFDRPPKWIAFFNQYGRQDYEDNFQWIGSPSTLTTEWGTGFAKANSGASWGTEGWGEVKMKRSEDGKTVSWYASGYTDELRPSAQQNVSGTTYRYMVIL